MSRNRRRSITPVALLRAAKPWLSLLSINTRPSTVSRATAASTRVIVSVAVDVRNAVGVEAAMKSSTDRSTTSSTLSRLHDIEWISSRRNVRSCNLELLVDIREAIELWGLAVYYDKSAWSVFRDACKFPSHATPDNTCVEWMLIFDGEESERLVIDAMTFILETPQDSFSAEYHIAKGMIRDRVGSAWDDAYQMPLATKFCVSAGHDFFVGINWHNNVTRCVQALGDQQRDNRSVFTLGPVSINLRQLAVNLLTNGLIHQLMNYYGVVPQFALTMNQTDTEGMARTMNDLMTASGDTTRQSRFVDELALAGPSGWEPFARVCHSVAQATTLRHLTLVDAFRDKVAAGRQRKWRWLGYALSNAHWMSSVRHLTIHEDLITSADVRHLMKKHERATDHRVPPDPFLYTRAIEVASDAKIRLSSGVQRTLSDLGFAADDEFLVADSTEPIDDTWMAIFLPGRGRCDVECESIVDARHIESSHGVSSLASLQLILAHCETATLPLLAHVVGTNLTKLDVCLQHNLILGPVLLQEVFTAAPLLQFLALRRVQIGTMDAIVESYRKGQCRVTTLSLWNVWVETPSLTTFANALANPNAIINQYLSEFRYVFDDLDDKDPVASAKPNAIGISAFLRMLEVNRTLSFVEIGLESQTFYRTYGPQFKTLDNAIDVSAISAATKLAFLSVLTPVVSSAKRQRLSGNQSVLRERSVLVPKIWSFVAVDRTIRRVVSVPRCGKCLETEASSEEDEGSDSSESSSSDEAQHV